jgi:hypothetical protein
VEEEMTVGVPISMPPPPQNYNPYPAQQQQGQNPYNPTNPPQGYYPTQNNTFNQGMQQPAVVMINNQRMAVPQYIYILKIELLIILNPLISDVHAVHYKLLQLLTISLVMLLIFGLVYLDAVLVLAAALFPS